MQVSRLEASSSRSPAEILIEFPSPGMVPLSHAPLHFNGCESNSHLHLAGLLDVGEADETSSQGGAHLRDDPPGSSTENSHREQDTRPVSPAPLEVEPRSLENSQTGGADTRPSPCAPQLHILGVRLGEEGGREPEIVAPSSRGGQLPTEGGPPFTSSGFDDREPKVSRDGPRPFYDHTTLKSSNKGGPEDVRCSRNEDLYIPEGPPSLGGAGMQVFRNPPRRHRAPLMLSLHIDDTYGTLQSLFPQSPRHSGQRGGEGQSHRNSSTNVLQNQQPLQGNALLGDQCLPPFLTSAVGGGVGGGSSGALGSNSPAPTPALNSPSAAPRRRSVFSRQASLGGASVTGRVLTEPSTIVPTPACPFDNENSHLVVHVGMRFCQGRFEALYELGTGGFGQVILCRDHHASGKGVVFQSSSQSPTAAATGSSPPFNTGLLGTGLYAAAAAAGGGGVAATGHPGLPSASSTNSLAQGDYVMPQFKAGGSPTSTVPSCPPSVVSNSLGPPPSTLMSGGVRRGSSSLVAIKVMRSDSTEWAQLELDSLAHLGTMKDDPRAEQTLVRYYGDFKDHGHHCFVFEHLKMSLLDVIVSRGHKGLGFARIRELSRQLLTGLACLASHNVIHADVKPENIMITEQSYNSSATAALSGGGFGASSTPRFSPASSATSFPTHHHHHHASSMYQPAPASSTNHSRPWTSKLIDFGSCCSVDDQPYTYIQSRYYRAPEVIVGATYDNRIDSWAAGATIAEMFLGLPLFPGTSEFEQLYLILERFDLQVPQHVLNEGCRADMYYNYRNGNGHQSTGWELKGREQFYKETQPEDPEIPQQPKCYRYTQFAPIINHRACLVEDIQAALEELRSGRAYERQETRHVLETGSVRSAFEISEGAVPPNYLSPSTSTLDLRVSQVKAAAQEQTRQVMNLIEYQRWLLADFLQKLLAVDPNNRLTPEAALTHPFLTY